MSITKEGHANYRKLAKLSKDRESEIYGVKFCAEQDGEKIFAQSAILRELFNSEISETLWQTNSEGNKPAFSVNIDD